MGEIQPSLVAVERQEGPKVVVEEHLGGLVEAEGPLMNLVEVELELLTQMIMEWLVEQAVPVYYQVVVATSKEALVELSRTLSSFLLFTLVKQVEPVVLECYLEVAEADREVLVVKHYH